MISKLLPALALSVSAAVPPQDTALRVRPEPQNVVASRLEGLWTPDAALCERLGVRVPKDTYEFASDASIAERVPDTYAEFLGQKRLYQAGVVTIRSGADRVEKYPYVLIENDGNPHLITFRERDGDAMGDAESSLLTAVPAKERKDDLLFLGGDFNNEPFRAYRRAQ